MSAAIAAGLCWLEEDADGAILVLPDGSRSCCTLSPSSQPGTVNARVGDREVELITGPRREPGGATAAVDVAAARSSFAPMIEMLVNQIAHDVRNYAFTVGLQAEMGLRRAAATPELTANFEAVLRQVEGLKRYLDQLLLYGRAPRLSPTAFDARAFIREQVQRYQFSWRREAPPVSIETDTGAPIAVRWDARAIAAAFLALLDNAVLSADPPPPVMARVVTDGDGRVRIEVVDRGPGIAPEVLERLQVPMQVRRAGGAGLGLAVARKLTQAHGGCLELSSSSDGTTAALVLPQEVAAA